MIVGRSSLKLYVVKWNWPVDGELEKIDCDGTIRYYEVCWIAMLQYEEAVVAL